MSSNAFSPTNTVQLAVNNVSSRVQLSGAGKHVRVYNAGPNTAFVKAGDNTVVATLTSMPIKSGAVEIFNFAGPDKDTANTHLAGITTGAETAILHLTLGDGGLT